MCPFELGWESSWLTHNFFGSSVALCSSFGNLYVDFASNLFTAFDATGNTNIAGTLDVSGATGVHGDFDIATDKFTVAAATGNTINNITISLSRRT